MNRTIMGVAIVGLLALSGVLGWVQAGMQSVAVNAREGEWHALILPLQDDNEVKQLRKRVLASGFFQEKDKAVEDSDLELNPEERALRAAEQEYGRFPHIISIARIDGLDTAQLRMPEGGVVTVVDGETLESGWVIAKIYPDYLEADAGSERFSFAVFEHKSNQEPENDDQQTSQP